MTGFPTEVVGRTLLWPLGLKIVRLKVTIAQNLGLGFLVEWESIVKCADEDARRAGLKAAHGLLESREYFVVVVFLIGLIFLHIFFGK